GRSGSSTGAERAWLCANDSGVLVVINDRRGENAWFLSLAGKPAWARTLSQAPQGFPALSGTIAVVPAQGKLVVLNAGEGHTLWSAPGGSPNLGAPVITDGRVIVGDSHDILNPNGTITSGGGIQDIYVYRITDGR